MTYNPNANWTSAVDGQEQAPVYYIDIDGLSTLYSSAPVSGTTTTVLMEPPQGGALSVDIIDGNRSTQTVKVELLDVSDAITDLVATEASGAPLSTLINRKATIYGGYRSLAVADYAAIYTGRITGVSMNRELTGYVLELTDLTHMLDGEVMLNATEATSTTGPTIIRGNIVNLYWAILTGTFSTTHGTFPLDSVTTTTSGSSAPTGLGIDTTLINEAQLTTERDTWHATDVGHIEFREPVNAKAHLENELFRVFQCFPTISGDGKLGLKFHVPALPASAAPAVSVDDHIISVQSWERLFGDHLNKFTIRGDYDHDSTASNKYTTILYNTETTEDTSDQSATGETIEYELESLWLNSSYDGIAIATELAGRMRLRYLKTPAVVDVVVNMRKRNLEQGDVIALTHPQLPNLLDGTRGLTAHLMTVISISPDFTKGVLRLRLLDTGYRRYGVIAPAAQADYDSATAQERNSFFFISNASDQMSDGTPAYRFI